MTPEWKFYPECGNPEIVLPERWAWVAIYSNGEFLEQFGQDGRFHQFREIDQSRLIAFQMINLLAPTALIDGNVVPLMKPPILVHWKPERKLIHFTRTIRLEVGTPNEREVRLYCFGYETQSKDKMILVIMPDDQIRVVEDVGEIPIA